MRVLGKEWRIAGKDGWFLLTAGWVIITVLNGLLLPRLYSPRVRTVLLVRRPMALVVRSAGNLEAKDSTTIRAQFDGRVIEKRCREGDKVAKGQLLFVMGRERIRLDRQQKTDALRNAEADLGKARKDLRLQKVLYSKDAVAYTSVEDAKTALVKAEQALRSAQEGMRLSDAQWNSSQVYAPFAGTVVKDWVGDDKFVLSGKEIVTVADISEFTMKARVDELEIKQVRPGQPAQVTVQIYEHTPLPAVVRDVGSLPDATGIPEVPVVLTIRNTQGLMLRPKLTAETYIFTGQTPPTLAVPLTAVANADGTPRVWALNFWGRIHSRIVTLGQSSPFMVEITSGLKEGERICMDAQPAFAEGMKVLFAAPAADTTKTKTKTNKHV